MLVPGFRYKGGLHQKAYACSQRSDRTRFESAIGAFIRGLTPLPAEAKPQGRDPPLAVSTQAAQACAEPPRAIGRRGRVRRCCPDARRSPMPDLGARPAACCMGLVVRAKRVDLG